MSDKLIFLSHIHEEAELAALFKDALENAFSGFVKAFVSSDIISIPAGAKFLNKIEHGLLECVGAIYLISPTSLKRNWINFELGAVWIRNVSSLKNGGPEIPAIPICHSGCTPGTLPMPLNNLNAVLGTESLQLERSFRSIQSAVGGGGALRTDFEQLASKVAALEQEGSPIQDHQAPTPRSPVTEPHVVKPRRHYSPADKDRIAETFHQLRETLNSEADPLQLEVQRMWQVWNRRQSRTLSDRPLDLKGTIEGMGSIRNHAARLSNNIFDIVLKENSSYEPLLKAVLDYRVPDPFRELQQHADRLRDALASAEAIHQESPHQSDNIVQVVVKILGPFSETNARLNGWIHATLRRIEEQEGLVLSIE